MPEFTLTDANASRNVDLGNSPNMTVTNFGLGAVQVFFDYQVNGVFTSAIKGSAGYASPFTLLPGGTKVVNRRDLESENVRVGIDGDGARVKFVY